MIADTFENLLKSRYTEIFEKLKSFIQSANAEMATGRYEIDGDKIFALVSHYETKPLEKGRMEYHKKYADVQMLLRGEEYINYTPLKGLTDTEPFSNENDIGFTTNPAEGFSSILIHPGVLAVFEPHDAHMPQMMVKEPTAVVKVVIKIDATLFN